MKLKAYGKINLSLGVTGRRDNGYHDIYSVMQDIDLHDNIDIRFVYEKLNNLCCTVDGVAIKFCMDDCTIPADETNLAVRGARAVLSRAADDYGEALFSNTVQFPEGKPAGLIISLEKNLPSAAGLAGGTADGAVTMLAVNSLLDNPYSLRELMDMGISIGSDFPYSIMMNACRNSGELQGLRGIEEGGRAAVVRGIGESVEPCPPVHTYVILMNPGVGVSTAQVYRGLDEMNIRSAGEEELYSNIMERYTLSVCSEAADLMEAMKKNLSAEHVMMSGSGPSIAACYTDREKAEKDFISLENAAWVHDSWKKWFVESGRRQI